MRIGHKELNGQTGHDAGRQLLAEMYREEVGQELPEILVTERGKPYFKDSPWHFSITHTQSHVFCALSQNPVGIDAEQMDRKANLHLADKILSAKEKQRYESKTDKPGVLLRLWVLKEAYAKLTGRGLGDYLYDTDFDPEDERVLQLHGCFVAVMEEKKNAV